MISGRCLTVLVLAAAAVACVNGGNGPTEEKNGFCHTVAGTGGDPPRATCPQATGVSDCAKAFDARFETFATVSAAGQATFSGAAAGQPAGSIAGVDFTLPDAGTVTIQLTTFLAGTQQEALAQPYTSVGGNENCGAAECAHSGQHHFVGLNTTLEYDQIEAAVSTPGTNAVAVNELCVR